MAIFISNSLYLSATTTEQNLPIIGWNSFYSNVDVSADSSLDTSGSGARNVWSSDTYSAFTASGATSGSAQYLAGLIFFVSDFFSLPRINLYGIAGHNFGSTGTAYKWQHRNTANTGWSDVTGWTIPSDDRALVNYTNTVAPPHQLVRLMIRVQPNQIARIAHVKIGTGLTLERRVWTGVVPAGFDVRTEKIGSKSYSGNHLGTVLVSQGESFSIEQSNNTVGFVRGGQLQSFFKHAILLEKLSRGPVESFFYSWRPTSHPRETQYCGKTNDFNPPKNQTGTSSGGLMQWSMSGDAFR